MAYELKNALGLIETIGLAAGVVAADSAVKSANVRLIGYELSKGGGMTTIKIEGDVGAVKAAVDSAVAAVSQMGSVYSTKVIPRPAKGLTDLIFTKDTVGLSGSSDSLDSSDPLDSSEKSDGALAGEKDEAPIENIVEDTSDEKEGEPQEEISAENLEEPKAEENIAENTEEPKDAEVPFENPQEENSVEEAPVENIENTENISEESPPDTPQESDSGASDTPDDVSDEAPKEPEEKPKPKRGRGKKQNKEN